MKIINDFLCLLLKTEKKKNVVYIFLNDQENQITILWQNKTKRREEKIMTTTIDRIFQAHAI